jgi:hypothetical protein
MVFLLHPIDKSLVRLSVTPALWSLTKRAGKSECRIRKAYTTDRPYTDEVPNHHIPNEVVAMLQNYDQRQADVVQQHAASLDKQVLIARLRQKRRKFCFERSMAGRTSIHLEISDIKKKLRDWTKIIRDETFLSVPQSVLKVKKLHKSGDWRLVRWDGLKTLRYSYVEDAFVRMLLTETAYRRSSESSGRDVLLGKYDRRETFEAATFAKLRMTGPEHFEAMDSCGDTATVPISWVLDRTNNVSLDSMSEATEKYKMGDESYCRIMPGDGLALQPVKISTLDVQISLEFHNSIGENQCAVKSLAAGLDYKGHHTFAVAMLHWSESARQDSTYLCNMWKEIKRISKPLGMKLRKRPPKHRYNPTAVEGRTSNIVLAQLKGRKGGLNHAVAFIGNLIFDLNYKAAIPLTAANVDLICGGSGYSSLYWAWELYETQKPPQWTTGFQTPTC